MKIFISYSRDSDKHRDLVFDLAENLRGKLSAEVVSDHTFNQKENPTGITAWMDKEINDADIVLVICTENYYRRAQGKEVDGIGKGIKWEGSIITQSIYNNDSKNSKFVPVIFSEKPADEISNGERDKLTKNIINCLRPSIYYILNISDLDSCKDYEKILRYITDQPEYIKSPSAASHIILPPKKKNQI